MNTARKYQELNVTTASPMQLVLMLYDECLRSLERGIAAFKRGDDPSRIEDISNNLLHAQDAITELAISLDMERGGEIAANLQRLYDFMVNHLSQGNVQKDVMKVMEVQRMMTELREAWVEVSKKEAVPEQPEHQPARQGFNFVG